MKTYIAILRGINVSGQKLIKMDLLRMHLQKINLTNVRTYIQSGNIIFESDQTNIKRIELDIATCIKNNFGFDVPVIVRSRDELRQIIKINPFLDEVGIEIDKLYVVFLEREAPKNVIAEIEKESFKPDDFSFSGKEIYLYCPNGYARTKLSNTYFEKKLEQKATTRNWKTVNRIYEISKSDV